MSKGRMEAFSDGVIAIALPVAFLRPAVACTVYVLVASMWLVPDRRIDKTLPRGDAPPVT